MPAHKSLPEPNSADPLSEPTVNRRVWAAYLRAGYTSRADWARALGVARYQNTIEWDKETKGYDLATLARAADLVGYTIDELVHGHRPAAQRVVEPALVTDADLIDALNTLGATPEQREALAEWRLSPAGKFADVTLTYVRRFCAAYSNARRKGAEHASAIVEANNSARHARVLSATVARGGRPVSTSALKALGAELRAVDGKPQRRKR